jgi:hypothetical protein
MTVPSEYPKVEVSVKVTQQEHMTIEAYQSPTPGLVVHRQVRWSPGKEEHKFTSKWQVTHAKSGLGLLTPSKCLPRQKDAIKFSRRLSGLTSWEDFDADRLSNDESLLTKVKSAHEGIIREQKAEDEGEFVVDEEYMPRYTIVRNRETRKYDVIDTTKEETVKTFSHRGTAWKEAHRLNEQWVVS